METKIQYEIAKDQETGDTVIIKHQYHIITEAVFPVLMECEPEKYNLAGQLLKGG